VAPLEGDVFRGRHVVTGGDKAESRGILATKREIKELREKLTEAKAALEQLVIETTGFEQIIALATAAIAGLSAEFHRQEKAIVGVEGQSQRAAEDEFRVQQRTELVQTEVSRVREEVAGLDARQAEARESIARLNEQRAEADETLSEAQRKLYEARETAEGLSIKAAEARAAHAGLVERSAGALAEVARMEDAAAELERRVPAAIRDMALMRDPPDRLVHAMRYGQPPMDRERAKPQGRRAGRPRHPLPARTSPGWKNGRPGQRGPGPVERAGCSHNPQAVPPVPDHFVP